MVMKKNHSKEFRNLWTKNRLNRLPLLFTIIARVVIAACFIFYICNYLTRFANALIIAIAIALLTLMVISRRLKKRSIELERLFIQNLHSRDIEAQVSGRKRPLFEGRLLDRNLHIGIFEVPEDSLWAGKQLQDLQLRNRFGIHVSSIQRGIQRLNIPNGETVIFPGDKIQAIGDDEQLADFSQALRKEMVAEDYDIEQRETKLRQLVLSGKSDFIGKTLQDSGIRDKYNCMVVGVEEGQQSLTMINPSRRFEKGDIIWVVGEESALNTIVQHC